jgi:two-component sensor histidine kinase
MSTRRKEIEMRKKKEEDILREDEQRNKRHQEFNERVKNSEVIIQNKKWKKEFIN